MAKITREHQKLFALNGSVATDNVAQFGSLKNNTANYSLSLSTIQSLTAWDTGWKGAVVNNNAPALQDLNAVQYVFSYQLGYLMQAGVPEWNASTIYYTGSLVNDGTGQVYKSLADDNTNNVLTDTTKWSPVLQAGVSTKTAGSETLDCHLFSTFAKTGSASATNIGLNNMVEGQTVTVLVSSVASQAAITWKRGTDSGGTADIKWSGGVVPTPTTTASRADRYVFQKIGGVIYGSADMNCY